MTKTRWMSIQGQGKEIKNITAGMWRFCRVFDADASNSCRQLQVQLRLSQLVDKDP